MDAAQIERVARQLHALYKQHEHNIQSYNNRKAGMDAGNSTPFFVERLKQLLDSIHENNRKYEEAYESYYSATGDVRYDDQYKKHSKACLAMEESLVNYIVRSFMIHPCRSTASGVLGTIPISLP